MNRYLKLAKRLILYVIAVLAMVSPIEFACGSPVQQFIFSQSFNQASGSIESFYIYPQTDTVGHRTVYTIDFVISGDTLTLGATLQLYFPVGFGFSSLDSVTYTDNDTSNTHFGIAGISSSPGLLSVKLSESGEAPAIGSKITLRLFGLGSSVAAATYQLIMAIISAENELIAVPTWSSEFELVPDRMMVFRLLPEGIQQVQAGTTLRYYVESFDEYSNPVFAQPIQWSVIGLPVQTGTVVDGDFQARFTGASRVVASYRDFADTSSIVYVLPGVFAYFGLTGGPDTAIAGVAWSDGGGDVVVTAYDLFGNVNYEFNGEIYFQSSDTLAELPFTAASHYRFLTSDLGRHTFRGSTFRLFTAGRHSLSLVKDGVVQQTLRSIYVQPGTISSFNVFAPEAVTAGSNFIVTITDAIDSWRNTVSGRVDLSLASGSGVSPSGGLPSLPSFLVTGGAGSATATLVKSGADSVQCSFGDKLIRRPVVVVPDSLADFDFQLDSPQVIGKPFLGVALLTALDRFGNTITSFSAQADSVTISASGTGRVFSNVIDQPYAFVNGHCDLKTIGTGYSGEALYSSFTATSRSGKKGVSPTVGFSILKITAGALVSATRYIGEQFIFNLTISNFGSQQAVVDSIRIYGGSDRLSPLTVSRALPDTISPLSNRLYGFTGTTPDRPNQSLDFSAQFFGHIGTVSVTDSIPNLATLTILPPEGISIIAQSLAPQQVTRGREYGFSLRIRNDSDDDLRLTSGTQLLLGSDANPSVTLTIETPIVIPTRTESALLRFAPGIMPSSVADSLSEISVHLVGTLGSISYDHTLPTFATVVTQTPPALSYQEASFAPTTIYRGREITPALDVVNTGTAFLSVNVATAELAFYAADRLLTTRLDASQLELAKGVSHIALKPIFVPADFPTAIDSVVLDISGTANGYTESFRIRLAGDVTSIPSGAAVQIISTHNNASNTPYVNVGQLFSIDVRVRNRGDEPLRDVVLRMASDGSSIHADSVSIKSLAVAGDTIIRFDIEASVTANSSELFSGTISHALGESSGLPAQILPPLNGTQVVVIQTPASLSLVSAISAPAEAQDGDVKPSTAFVLSAKVDNSAQAVVGGGELTMRIIAGSFSTIDASMRSFDIGQEVAWTIVAPSDADTGRFEIAISAIPQDSNTGMAAGVVNRVDTIVVVSSEVYVALSVDFVPLQSALLSAGRTYEMLTLDFDVVGASEKPYLDFIDFALLNRAHHEIDPSLVLTAAELRYNDQSTVAGVITGGRYRFELGEDYGTPRSATISLTLRADPQMADFSLYLDSNSFAAAYRTPAGAKPVPISARFASRLIIKEDVTLVPSGLDKSFFSYPNPFSPLTETATIVYSLAAAKPAILTIYTLTGDKVITRDLPAPAALDQPVTVSWDGRNGDGQIVLNGVYIAVLSIEGEPEVRTKIAVMK